MSATSAPTIPAPVVTDADRAEASSIVSLAAGRTDDPAIIEQVAARLASSRQAAEVREAALLSLCQNVSQENELRRRGHARLVEILPSGDALPAHEQVADLLRQIEELSVTGELVAQVNSVTDPANPCVLIFESKPDGCGGTYLRFDAGVHLLMEGQVALIKRVIAQANACRDQAVVLAGVERVLAKHVETLRHFNAHIQAGWPQPGPRALLGEIDKALLEIGSLIESVRATQPAAPISSQS